MCQRHSALFCCMLATLAATSAALWPPPTTTNPVAYRRHLSELRIHELQSIAARLEHSINPDKYACESYFDYVCSRNKPLFSVLGQQPEVTELIELLTELQEDHEKLPAKQKLMDFFISCNTIKSLEDCYRESFEYFKPLYGYIIAKNHIDASSHEHRNFLEILEQFVTKAEHTDNFRRNPIRLRLATLREKFRLPQLYFYAADINREYQPLQIYRESYKHNLRNLQRFQRYNSTFEEDVKRTMLDWTLYVHQSRHKPMSYYYPTLNVHLWMTLYNSTARLLYDTKYYTDAADCLKLPQFVNALDEARIMAVVYLKSFRMAWQEYRDWIDAAPVHQYVFDQENEVMKPYHLNNKALFFTLYAQNFCDFGKEVAENVFYLGLRQNQDFFRIYSCGYQTERSSDCV